MTITTKDSRSLFTFEVEEILQMHRKTKVHFPFNNEKPKKKKKKERENKGGLPISLRLNKVNLIQDNIIMITYLFCLVYVVIFSIITTTFIRSLS